MSTTDATVTGAGRLTALHAGQLVPYGGDRVAVVDDQLAASFRPGDHLVVVQDTGDLLHVPAAEHELVRAAVDRALEAFHALAEVDDERITGFFDAFAAALADDDAFAPVAEANRADVATARERGRSTTRLELTERMRADMVAGLRSWRDAPSGRDDVVRVVRHAGWHVEARQAPLGVVGFVFEGRPNVVADAAGVVRTGNTAVFRIGSDALGPALALHEHAIAPALRTAGLPAGAIELLATPARAAGWALFGDRRVALAVARGSGAAVAQLGAVARQAGIPVSLHGTGGAWLLAGDAADPDRFAASVEASLDRKVCNTLNVCCIPRHRAGELVPRFVEAVTRAAAARDTAPRLHVEEGSAGDVDPGWFERRVVVHRADGEHDEPFASVLPADRLGHEWEWERSPEVTLVLVDDLADAVARCNAASPRFVVSVVSDDPAEFEQVYATVDAPFVGDAFTRWVDGQYALGAPELGLSNWEGGRLLGRAGVLSGDSVHTVRLVARFDDPTIRR